MMRAWGVKLRRILECVCFPLRGGLCVSAAPSWSELVVLVIVAVNGDAAVVGDGSWHGGHPRDDACGRVVAQDGVGGLAVLPSAAQDEDLPVADWHAAALLQPQGETGENSLAEVAGSAPMVGDRHVFSYLFVKGVNHVHPVVLYGVVAEDGLGQTAAHVDQVIEGNGSDATPGDGDVGPQQPGVALGVVALNLQRAVQIKSTETMCDVNVTVKTRERIEDKLPVVQFGCFTAWGFFSWPDPEPATFSFYVGCVYNPNILWSEPL